MRIFFRKRAIVNQPNISKRVLVVATSRKTRGGITAVIKAHETGEQWKKFHCHWVQTHRDGPLWRKLLYFISGMADFLIRLPFYDIVHIHISQPTSVTRKNLFLRIAKLARKRVIAHFHAFNTDETIAGTSSKKYQSFFTKADKVIVLSNWWKSQLINVLNIPVSKIVVLYNPCPNIVDGYQKKGNIILYAGTVNRRKGYYDLIKSFSIIAAKYPGWKLVIAGNGEIDEGRELCGELKITSQVDFVGWVSGVDKDSLFRRTDIFCLPSYAEGFPMAVLDAWAYGLPVITTPVGGIPDVAVDGENMLLFNPGDVDKLADNIEMLITNADLRSKISRASLTLAKGQFNINTINSQLEHIYTSLAR
jgi:glycosyltransferase involved in cell wall biosynthesis